MRQRDPNFFRRILEDGRSEILEEAERAPHAQHQIPQEARADPSGRAPLEIGSGVVPFALPRQIVRVLPAPRKFRSEAVVA